LAFPNHHGRIALRTDSGPDCGARRYPSPRGWLVLGLALTPSLAALAWVRPFVTQDGPAHVYNAHILVESLRPDSPFRDSFETQWALVPNWTGHLVLMALVDRLPPVAAEQTMMALTLVGVSVSTLLLRTRVRGRTGECVAALYTALLGLNAAWLFGFHNFLLGASAFGLTLTAWWAWRDRFDFRRALAFAMLAVLGYFCHLASLALTVLALGLLALVTPGERYQRRLLWSLTPLLVVLPLVYHYKTLSAAGGEFRPMWRQFTTITSAAAWGRQIAWVDPITLGSRWLLPFADRPTAAAILVQPVIWLAAGLAFAAAVSRFNRERAGWTALAGILLLLGLIVPDGFGTEHGDYLPQRVLLLGLIALAPVLDFPARTWGARISAAAFVLALVAQSSYVWDYAVTSRARVGELLAVKRYVATRNGVGTLVIDLRDRFRANPMLHADCLLGVGTGNIIWSNYEAAHYYFPVHFRPNAPHPPQHEFEELSKMDDPADAEKRRRRWRELLEDNLVLIDRLVIVGSDAALEEIAALWFKQVASQGRTRVWERRSP
jgi:hypothetical protein